MIDKIPKEPYSKGMNIGLIGYGKMGKMVEAAALAKGHSISLVVDPLAACEKASSGTALLKALPDKNGIAGTDICIEFTGPASAPDNIKAVAALGKPVVSGSTGWHGNLPDVTEAVKKADASLLWSSNFSLGVNLFYRIIAHAAIMADPFEEYDLGGLEIHHNKKADSPSGTAKVLMERVLPVMKRKTKVLWDTPEGALNKDTVHFASIRYGSVPGTHSLFFDSPADTIEITHTARSREGFASGALQAAIWLASKKQSGVFTFEDMLKEIL